MPYFRFVEEKGSKLLGRKHLRLCVSQCSKKQKLWPDVRHAKSEKLLLPMAANKTALKRTGINRAITVGSGAQGCTDDR
jgi:hypothetical protein